MRFSASIIAFITFVATPATSLNLYNGVSIVNVEVEPINSSTLAERDTYNCKGSSLCTNNQSFKNQCSSAYNLIEDTTYTPGGASSGVCSGNCGVFIQSTPGNSCPTHATGQNLRDSYNAIRANGCQACGSDENGACEITINYVTGC